MKWHVCVCVYVCDHVWHKSGDFYFEIFIIKNSIVFLYQSIEEMINHLFALKWSYYTQSFNYSIKSMNLLHEHEDYVPSAEYFPNIVPARKNLNGQSVNILFF